MRLVPKESSERNEDSWARRNQKAKSIIRETRGKVGVERVEHPVEVDCGQLM